MKEFEKWEKVFYANHQGNFHFDPTCKMGWRAALEWVWKTMEHLSPSDYELLEEELKK